MNNQLIEVKIENYEGKNVVSSRIIAEQLGKRHSDVIKQIELILTDENIRSLIILSNYKDSKGENRKQYLLSKDGFVLYMFNIQGYNDFKLAYINKFNQMQNNANNPLNILLSMKKEELVENVLKLAQIVKEKDELIEIQKPKVDFYNSVIDSKDTIDIGQLAKTLNIKGVGRNKLFEILREKAILDRKNIPFQIYVDRGYFKTIETSYTNGGDTKIHIKTVVFQKGVDYINKLLKNEVLI